MLRDVGQLFSKLTRGRYIGLRRRLDEQGTLILAEASGKDKEPKPISGGTREQLYLAIRLAYARHYCRENEPLPLVMDDVLVNFDDERSEAALDMLVELAQDIQLIFLTCHQETIRRIRHACPKWSRHCLLDAADSYGGTITGAESSVEVLSGLGYVCAGGGLMGCFARPTAKRFKSVAQGREAALGWQVTGRPHLEGVPKMSHAFGVL